MKAWILHEVNKLYLEELEKPIPDRDEVLVAVKAVGICGSDIPRIYQTGAHTHPLVPGHEFSGVVEATGADVDTAWNGKRVGIFPLIPCKNCLPCKRKQYEMCRHYDYLGSRRNGGFAEYAAVPAECLVELPDNVSFAEAAMLEPMAVAVHAMRRAFPEVRDFVSASVQGTQNTAGTVVICGLGTIGLLLLMMLLERRTGEANHPRQENISNHERGKAAEAGHADGDIFVIGNKDFQKQMILELGLPEDAYCDSRMQDAGRWLAERTGNRGADVFFECVGKNETLRLAVDTAAPGGRICLVGNPYTDMQLEKSVYWKILRNQLTLTGTWNSSFTGQPEDDWSYVLKMLSRKRIMPEKLITHRFPLSDLEKGLHIMRDKSEDYVKIMSILS
ncbi:MAG TPA: galactitol-1-phosphate 5-dehydrogenase [Lachnospiraceae bacterium]|nr:galactitol-1-phosphate 5-dehydrogenase [Lachnospiraceae bacterium]